jgi:hypothetical protein
VLLVHSYQPMLENFPFSTSNYCSIIVSLKMQYGTAFEQVLIKQSRCWNYCIPSDCTSAAEMAERPVLFVSNFPSWVHGFGRVCDSGEVLAILCCLNALRFVDLWFF